MVEHISPYLDGLKNRIDLLQIPFGERGSRLLIFKENHHLVIRLAERWLKLSGDISAYRNRPPLIDRMTFCDPSGNTLPLNVTTYPDTIQMQTPIGVFELVFLDTETLILSLPATKCKISFLARLDQALTDRRGGLLHLTGNIRRSIAYTTNAHILENTHQTVNGGMLAINLTVDASQGNKALLLNITPRLGYNRWVSDMETARQTAAKRWVEWFSAAPPVLEEYQSQYYYAWWIMRAGILSTRFYTTREVMTPSKSYYIGSWQWDNFFHSLAYRHIDSRLAQDQLRILLDHQREDGMIPDAIHDEGTITHLDFPVDADVTKPPLIAWAAWKIYEFDHDREFLDEIYGPILKSNDWWFEKNDLDGNGLCEYHHPFSSGLDDSPLWDEGMPVEAPDLNTYLYLQMETLSKIAKEIGEDRDSERWLQRAESLVSNLIKKGWDEKAGVFWATHLGKPIHVLTPMNLFPLITGRMPASIVRRLVGHLFNPQEFAPKFPVPTVALNDPKYDPVQMWRGPTWANINYLLIEGLGKSGDQPAARELRKKTLDLLLAQRDFYEYYNPETGENSPNAAPIFGWSASLFIDMAIQATREAIRLGTAT